MASTGLRNYRPPVWGLLLVLALGVDCASPARAAAGKGVVVDANGVVVGAFIPFIPYPTPAKAAVQVKFNRQSYYVLLQPIKVHENDGSSWTDFTKLVPAKSGGNVVYDGPSCTGKAYVYYDTNYMMTGFPPTVTLGDGVGGGRLYVGANVKPIVIAVHSSRTLDMFECSTQTGDHEVVPLTEVFDLAPRFAAPYTLR